MGAAVKPVVGVFDMASKISEGAVSASMSNEAYMEEMKYRSRLRLPRLLRGLSGGLFSISDREDGLVRQCLKSLHESFVYSNHALISSGRFVLLSSTDEIVLFLAANDETARIVWRLAFTDSRATHGFNSHFSAYREQLRCGPEESTPPYLAHALEGVTISERVDLQLRRLVSISDAAISKESERAGILIASAVATCNSDDAVSSIAAVLAFYRMRKHSLKTSSFLSRGKMPG